MCVAGAALVFHSQLANAQSEGAKPGKANELRAVYASPADVAEGKRLALASCGRCHGADGISTTKGVPHLAAQRPGYLLLELRAYQKGVRTDKAMEDAVKFLSDDALVKVAAYYASLEPAQPSATVAGKTSAASLDPVQAGKVAAADCNGCHGDGGISTTPGMPSLVGFDPKYFVAAVKAYVSGQRKNDMMKSLVAGLSDADLENVALYYALQKPPTKKVPATLTATQAAGKTAAAACDGCHGAGGVSSSPANPSIAGQDKQYLATALQAYKAGTRSDETMKGLSAALDDRTINDMADFYQSQQAQRPKVSAPLTIGEWAQRCDRCHGLNGNSTDPMSPALAGQRGDYLENVLHAYRTRARKSAPMAAMAKSLTEADVVKIAAHYSRQKPRAVVFIAAPGK